MSHSHRPDGRPPGTSRPVFTDLSGQRRRLMLVLGAAGSLILAGALSLVALSLFGGPNTPLSFFGPPHGHSATDRPVTGGRHHQRTGGSPVAGGAPSGPGQTPHPTSSSRPSPTPTSSSPAQASPSASPAPTNKAGKTPPGRSHSPTAHPHPSRSSHG